LLCSCFISILAVRNIQQDALKCEIMKLAWYLGQCLGLWTHGRMLCNQGPIGGAQGALEHAREGEEAGVLAFEAAIEASVEEEVYATSSKVSHLLLLKY